MNTYNTELFCEITKNVVFIFIYSINDMNNKYIWFQASKHVLYDPNSAIYTLSIYVCESYVDVG